MAIYSGRMLVRKGNESDYAPDKLMPGEWALSTDKKIARICVSAGVCIRMATYEAFEEDMVKVEKILSECQNIQEAVVTINEQVSENADAVVEYTAQAKKYRDEAETFRNEAKVSAEKAEAIKNNDYTYAVNKPSINNVELLGNKTLEELDIQQRGDYCLVAEAGHELKLSIDNLTYLMTLQLLNSSGDVLSEKTIDFPIESMVINATYANGKIKLTLQNGNTLDVDVSALVSGLVKDTFTIAGIDMKDDITVDELKKALGLEDAQSASINEQMPTFSEAEARENIVSGDNISTLFGKIMKWFSDLKSHAFSEPVNNLLATVTGTALDAVQGKILDDKITETNEDIDTKTNATISVPSYETKFVNAWTRMSGLSGDYVYRGVTYGNDRFVCVGNSGSSYYSLDGETWVSMTGLDTSMDMGSSNISINYSAVTYGNGRFVAVSLAGSSYYSTDGVTWSPMSGLDVFTEYYGVAYGNGRFVAVGNLGSSYYSTDGETWTAMSGLPDWITVGTSMYSVAYYGVTYGNDRFVCVGSDGAAYYSIDGETWTPMSGLDTSKTYNAVTYGNGRFVAVGFVGSSYYSTDGETWSPMSGLLPGYAYYGVTYGNGIFVAVGNHSGAYYSIDGETWVAGSAGDTISSIIYRGVTYGNGRFVNVSSAYGLSHYLLDTTTIAIVFTETEAKVTDIVTELYSKSVIIRKTLTAGETEISITNENITEDSVLSFYTSIFGINPIGVKVEEGSVTLTFDAQETDMEVGVSIDG